MTVPVRLLLISGSLRAGSGNRATLATLAEVGRPGVAATFYDGLGGLPHFNPDDDHEPLPAAVAALRQAIADADAVVFCTPEYAGDLPGSLKNLLDWTVGGTEICDKPAAWINVATSPAGAAGAHQALRTVLGYTGADIVDAACLHLPVRRDAVGPDGTVHDADARAALAAALGALTRHIRG